MRHSAARRAAAPKHRQATALVEAASGKVVALRGSLFFSDRRLQEARDTMVEELVRKLVQQLGPELGPKPDGHGVLHLLDYEACGGGL